MSTLHIHGRLINSQSPLKYFRGVRLLIAFEVTTMAREPDQRRVTVPVALDGTFSTELVPDANGRIEDNSRIYFALRDGNGNALPLTEVRSQGATAGTGVGAAPRTNTKTVTGESVAAVLEKFLVASSVGGAEILVTTSFDNSENLVSASSQVLAVAQQQPNKRLRGKVVDERARLKLRDTQVVIWGTRSGSSTGAVLGVATTDGEGSFALPYPYGAFKELYATVSIQPQVRLPIVASERDEMPEFVWLVVSGIPETVTQEAHDACACSARPPSLLPDMEQLVGNTEYAQDVGGSCVNFTTPNRALEEFAYVQVVRTTDPELYSPTRYRIEDRLAWVTLRIAELRKQLLSFSAFPSTQLHLVGDLNELTAPEGDANARSSGTTTDAGSNTAEADASALERRLDAQGDVTREYFQAGIYNKNRALLQRELQILTAERERLERQIEATGRVPLTGRNPIDWDDSDGKLGTVQAATIAHGHLLHLKQVWRAAGYSLGDLLYSLPLAPGQKKQIAVMEWDRRETASRQEQLTAQDQLSSELVHDRDVNEIVRANLSELQSGASHSLTKGVSGGVGVGMGTAASGGASGSYQGINLLAGFSNMLGVSGGLSKSKGESWSDSSQSSTRDLFSASEQSLRDRTLQNASSVRSQRASVVTTVGQSEAFRVTTEVVANHNHCHALTLQYFEVLRHFAVHHELADVQECLFVPFLIESFDRKKILRWRDVLSTYLRAPTHKIAALRAGFDALQRVEDELHGDTLAYAAFPSGRYCDELLEDISGELALQLHVARPEFSLPTATDYPTIYNAVLQGLTSAQSGLSWWSAGARNVAQRLAKQIADKAELDALEERYQGYLAHENFVDDFCKTLKLKVVLKNDPSHKVDLQLDVTILSNQNWYRNDKARLKASAATWQAALPTGRVGDHRLRLSMRPTAQTYQAIAAIKRADVLRVEISAGELPFGSTCRVVAGRMGYQTAHGSGQLFSSASIENDIDGSDAALISTPLTAAEMHNPRHEDSQRAAALEQHLEANKEYYHKLLWLTLDDQRVFNLLDKYTIEVPRLRRKTYTEQGTQRTGLALDVHGKVIIDYETRSVASLVDHKRLGFAGNSVIFPVAKGLNLNRDFLLVPNYQVSPSDRTLGVISDAAPVDLIDFYKPAPGTKHEPKPFRISVPTRGLFAEAVMGACNSCEKIDDTRFWKWEEHPIDEPTAIAPVSTDTRRSEPGNLEAKDFAAPVVSIQNVPAAPDPTGLAKALELLGKPDVFRDVTGLTETQKNALAALATTSAAATQYATLAKELATKAGDNSLGAMTAVSAYDLARRDKLLAGLDKLDASALDADDKAALTKRAFEQLIEPSSEVEAAGQLLQEAQQGRDKGKYDDAIKVLERLSGSQKVEIAEDGGVKVEQPVVSDASEPQEISYRNKLEWLEELDLSGVSERERWAYGMSVMKAIRDGLRFDSKQDILDYLTK